MLDARSEKKDKRLNSENTEKIGEHRENGRDPPLRSEDVTKLPKGDYS
jgi:hypothetical protein